MGKSVLRRILGDGGGLGGLVGVYITHQLVACDGLLGQKVESYLIQEAAVVRQELFGVSQDLSQNGLDLLVHLRGI